MLIPVFLAALLLPNFILCGPMPDVTTESFLIVGSNETGNTETSKEPRLPELKSMHVTANIRNRYARTTVETKYSNPEDQSQEATFTITLPDAAFISGFVMEINQKTYVAYVKEKEEAKKEYQQAVERGQSAGHVAMNARDSKVFTVSVNVGPLSKVLFTLTYEQLLQRKHGKYEMVINLHPGQLVDDFTVDVNINETRRIVDVNTPALRSGNEIIEATKVTKNHFVTMTKLNEDDTEVNIHFSPSVEQQQEMMVGTKGADENKGISGQFVVEYDVERDPHGGEVIVDDGYFVHFFAPQDLKPIPKHVVFVLDVSGSMAGRKIKQLRDAMKVILGELNSEDYFHLVKFSSDVQIWNKQWNNIDNLESELPQAYLASKENIENVQKIVEKMTDEGLTNIHDALAVALRLTAKGVAQLDNEIQKNYPIIVFLTDGQTNVGNTNYDEILKMVKSKNNENNAAIFALSFGDSANKDFLKKLASNNLGFMRTIYEAADASLQLEKFYREISSPLLTNVNFTYGDEISNMTNNKFDIFFKGSELVVAGKINPSYTISSFKSALATNARTSNGTLKFTSSLIHLPKIPKPEQKQQYGNLERLWAYMTIQKLLNNINENANKDETSTSEKEALAIALKYSFVTPVSSLVVVKPNSTELGETEPANKKNYAAVNWNKKYSMVHKPTGYRSGGSRSASSRFRPSTITSSLQMSSRPVPHSYHVPHSYRPSSLGSGSGQWSISHHSTYDPDKSPTPTNTPLDNLCRKLPWLVQVTTNVTNEDEMKIDNQIYLIGSYETTVETKSCQVNTLNLSGNCTLLTACPKIYPTLDSLNTYRKYFCTLDSGRYAGVCCVDN